MQDVRAPLFVRLAERGWGQAVPAAGELTGITISDVTAIGSEWTSAIMGLPGHDVSDIALSNVRISGKGGGAPALISQRVPQQRREYPDAARFRYLPAHGLFCRHVTALRIDRASLTVEEPDPRPALILADVREAAVKGLVATASSDGGPVAWLRSTQDCLLDGVRSPTAETLARLSGAETARARVVAAGDAHPQVVLVDPEVEMTALHAGAGVTARRPGGRRAAGLDGGQQGTRRVPRLAGESATP
jgi:hypothetical protein